MTTEELVIKLSADNSDLRKKLDQSKSDVSGFGTAINKMGAMATAAYIGMGAAALKFAKDSFMAFEAQEKANKRLLFALKGNTSEFNELTKQATKFQSTTGIADDAIQGIQTLAAQSGRTRQEIEKITEATINWSSLTGQDLQSAYMQINGTLNGTAGRLTRVDSQFGTLTETQLKNGAAIDLINTKYKDFAANSATALEKLSANWDEFKESAGSLLADVINPLFDALNDGISNINRSEGFWQKLGSFVAIGSGNPYMQAALSSSLDAQEITKNAVSTPVEGATYNATGVLGIMQGIADKQKAYNDRLKEGKKDQTDYNKAFFDYMQMATDPRFTPDSGVDSVYYAQMRARAGYTGVDMLAPDMAKATNKPMWSSTGSGLRKRASGGAMGTNFNADELKKVNSELALMQSKSQIATNAISDLGEALGTMAATGEISFKSMVGSMLGGIRQIISAKLAEAMASMIAGEATKGLPGLVFAAIGMGAVQAMFANIPAFAGGGIVGGSYFSGDNVTARVNSGEMILNASQQAQLFAMANGGGGNGQLHAVIRAGDIYLASKRGQYLSKRRGNG